MNKNKLLGKIKEAGLSQRSLAKQLSMSENTLSSRINGRSSFNLDEVDAICSYLDITDGKLKAEIFLNDVSQ